MNELLVSIGPIAVRFNFDFEYQYKIPEHILPFLISRCEKPMFLCHVTHLKNETFLSVLADRPVMFSDDLGNKVYSEKDDSLLFLYKTGFIAAMEYHNSNNTCTFYLNKETSIDTAPFIVDSTPMMMAIMLYLNEKKGLLLHSSAIKLYNEMGICLCGPSGSGKSTITRLFNENTRCSVLTDETVLVWIEDGIITIYGTHWKGSGGDFYKNDHVILNSIFYLQHGKDNILNEMSFEQAVRKTVLQAFPLYWNQKYMIRLISIVGQMLAFTHYYQYSFLPDRSSVQFIIDQMRKDADESIFRD